ncbi:MAG: tetratricopeptide repeat protein, partial [Candidatus Gastranaerophilales bacterium]|nr:tetratricopeptide repeat protein [Candidatus Gastranaerophilales bacterium]
MKKFCQILTVLALAISTSACDLSNISLSRPDVYKLNQKAAEYMNQGLYDDAIARLVAINDLEPNHPEVYYNLGIAYIKKEDYPHAIEALKKAVELKPDMADAYFSLGIAYESLTDLQIQQVPTTKDFLRQTELKTQIAQNVQAIYDCYSRYLEKAPN